MFKINSCTKVSLFVRLWVEIFPTVSHCWKDISSASSWGCELKYLVFFKNVVSARSASSWGCELKFRMTRKQSSQPSVSLFVRLWVEIYKSLHCRAVHEVSLFVRLWVEILRVCDDLLSWLVSLFVRLWVEITRIGSKIQLLIRSASSWGCELKYPFGWDFGSLSNVSLFVRLWVEINSMQETGYGWNSQPLREAVSWNKWITPAFRLNKRQPLREAVSWNIKAPINQAISIVSLFVRLWVEMLSSDGETTAGASASSWGCELKYNMLLKW